MNLEEKLSLYESLCNAEVLHKDSYEDYYEKVKLDNVKAIERAREWDMPVYAVKGKKNSDKKNTIAFLEDIIKMGEAAKEENLYLPEFEKYRKIISCIQFNGQKVFVEASTFLMIEKGKFSGEEESFDFMINNCILLDAEKILENVAKKVFKELK